MVEKPTLPESVEEAPRPNELDIVKINGRWAQVISAGERVKYLDNLETEEIEWSDYKLTRSYKSLPMHAIIDWGWDTFTETEIQNTHWAKGDLDSLKKHVSVFGVFVKKSELS